MDNLKLLMPQHAQEEREPQNFAIPAVGEGKLFKSPKFRREISSIPSTTEQRWW